MHRSRAVAIALVAGLSILAPVGPRTPAVSAQTFGGCKPLVSIGSGEHVPRPTAGGLYALSGPEAAPLGGQRVLVHYTRVGTDKPPLTDADGNGYPDYVEKVEQAGEGALAFYEAPLFDKQPFTGFDSNLCDTGGPDSRLDIYVRDLGVTLGRSFGPQRAQGGGFTIVSPRLASHPSGPAIFKGDGIAFTVSHELFHLVQFGYVPEGMPGWVAEGTANTLALFYNGVDHPVLLHQADMWLRNPGRPLWYPGFSCDRCYGGIWWWAVARGDLRAYFEQLAALSHEPEGIGNGVEALETTFENDLPAFETLITPALYTSFAFSFAPAMTLAAYPRTIKPPPTKYSVAVDTRVREVHATLRPMSVQFVAIAVRRPVRSVELVTTSREGPDPWPSLFAGFKHRPGRRAQAHRTISTCFAAFATSAGPPPTSHGVQDHRIAFDIKSPLERKRDMLVVANPSNQTLRYTLRYSGSRRRARFPSPWGSSPAASSICPKHAFWVAGTDPIGSGEDTLAPDIGELVVASTKVLTSGDRLVTFAVRLGNRAELGRGDVVTVWIDSDQSSLTGCGPWGAEYALEVHGRPGPDTYRLGRCRGGSMSFAGAQGRFIARLDRVQRRLLFLVSARDIHDAVFNFKAQASWTDGAGGQHTDLAPNTSLYCFPDCRGGRAGIPTLETQAWP